MIESPPERPPTFDEQLALTAAIIERADRTVHPNGLLLLAWGLISGIQNLLLFSYYSRYYSLGADHAPELLRAAALQLSAVSVVATVVVLALGPRRVRQTVVDRQLWITFLAAWAVAKLFVVLEFPGWAFVGPSYALLENALFALAMLSLGLQYRSRVLAFGGCLLVLSIVVARLDVDKIGLYLALGQFVGLALPGAIFALRRR